jgi:predicted membrane-bound spermidine synthase
MKKTAFILLSISILEGGALMATELIGAKLAAPFYGTSLYVWATIFAVTLGGLALGYLLGGYFSDKNPSVAFLRKVLLGWCCFHTNYALLGKVCNGANARPSFNCWCFAFVCFVFNAIA